MNEFSWDLVKISPNRECRFGAKTQNSQFMESVAALGGTWTQWE
jgi:hypothetical protein